MELTSVSAMERLITKAHDPSCDSLPQIPKIFRALSFNLTCRSWYRITIESALFCVYCFSQSFVFH